MKATYCWVGRFFLIPQILNNGFQPNVAYVFLENPWFVPHESVNS